MAFGGTKKYLLNFLIGFDQWCNTIIAGMPDETISSRCGRGYGKKWYWTWLGKFLNFLDPGHIKDAVANELNNSHQPVDLRK